MEKRLVSLKFIAGGKNMQKINNNNNNNLIFFFNGKFFCLEIFSFRMILIIFSYLRIYFLAKTYISLSANKMRV